MPRVLGIDSSTGSTKVELRDADDGTLLARGAAPHPATTPPRSEQHPSDWWRALELALEQVGTTVGDVDAVAVAGQQHGMVVLDVHGEVVRAAKLWNDTESAADAAWLVQQTSAQAWAETCGSVPLAAFTIAKLSWLHRSEPESWRELARVCLPHDWLTLQLCGELVTDRGDASGTGYWSPASNDWALQLLAIVSEEIDWAAAVPRVCQPTERLTSRDGTAVVAPGTGDNMAAALGVGLRDGQVVISLGTSGTVYARANSPTADGTGAVAGFADATGHFLPLVCTLNATKVTDAIARLLGCDHGQLDALALQAAPRHHDEQPVVVPYFDGERTPNRPDASGSIIGLRSAVSREQIARAAYEGVVCGMLDGLDALGACGIEPPQQLLLVGGGARSRAYRQVLADLAQCAVAVPSGGEHVALGAAVQAAATLHGAECSAIADAWGLGGGAETAPAMSADIATERRAAYAIARGP